MSEQLTLLEKAFLSDNLAKKKAKVKRNWEYAFQKWSDDMFGGDGNINGYGCCGYGAMCDWCDDNSYGRPCVRALNKMCREKRIKIDYSNRDFAKVWKGRTEDGFNKG